MIKISFVFYQFPQALHELEDWEIKNKPIKEVIDDKGRIVYSLKNEEGVYEKLYCFNINNFTLEEIKEVFIRSDIHIKCSAYEYSKTLIFGKVTLINLLKVTVAIQQFELEKQDVH